ncbi:hypothetical protein C7B62_00140 [Pleurocapsa sp. CCALA 161]|uniref:hypothetical protein n=1 Tax=Pleurocapsa sp. CCALA 161 TaxID=2107688 RepID=UPI000D07D7A0|nr:hypothetical protein [Pleurocapsa sp. CCALA 161]PSB12807.1 hypothetical protein C7B62_00140 [Pleurocapsa sp. CCALA 161]
MIEFEYLTDKDGKPKAVVIPIEVWQRITTIETVSEAEISAGIEDYCLNKAMDEAKNSPLLDRAAALEFLEE